MKHTYSLALFFILFITTSCYEAPTDKDNIKGLTALGQLWGFLKYHHPTVAAGKYDWDKELMKRIPDIRNAGSEKEWKERLNAWVDSLPPVPPTTHKELPPLEVKQRPDYAQLFDTAYFLPQTIEKLQHILGNAAITSNHYVSIKHGIIDFGNEAAYDTPLLPDTEHRLLALFRHWNIINYFFPYRSLCDQRWSEVLPEMIPAFMHANNTLAYYKACQKLEAKIDDSHGFYVNNHASFIQSIGTLHPPFFVRFIEDKPTITRLIAEEECRTHDIRLGDIITSINKIPIDTILKKELPYTAASNHPTKLRNIADQLLRSRTDTMELTIARDNREFQVHIRCHSSEQLKKMVQPGRKKADGYQIIKDNIGYIYPANCNVKTRTTGIKKVLTGTQGVIVDFRCYPSDYISLPFLKQVNHRISPFSLVTFMDVAHPGYAFTVTKGRPTPGITQKKNAYDKKIVVIVDERTQSQAEDQVLGFQLATNVTVIGSTTAGANGAIAHFKLPGGITTYMSGKGVYYPDGSNLQREGVKIDEVISPTIQGIRENRDELLERAVEIILSETN